MPRAFAALTTDSDGSDFGPGSQARDWPCPRSEADTQIVPVTVLVSRRAQAAPLRPMGAAGVRSLFAAQN